MVNEMKNWRFSDEMAVFFIADHAPICRVASEHVSRVFPKTTSIFWSYGTERFSDLHDWTCDYIISFKSDLILSSQCLSNVRCGAINFHPSCPKYRGIGGEYYAIWNGDREFGATCHVMDHEVDHGTILDVIEFPIEKGDLPASIKIKADEACLDLLDRFLTCVVERREIRYLNLRWDKTLYTRRMLALEKEHRIAINVPKERAASQV
jgi:methionyl-tRNA formyltransferase